MKTLLLRLLALALIAGGIVGLGKWRFERRYYQSASFTFAGATPQQIDEIFNGALTITKAHRITRTSSAPNKLDFHAEGASWDEARQLRDTMYKGVQKAAQGKKILTASTSYGGSNFQEPRYLYGAKSGFLASAAVVISGLAMMILSLRVFGGGRRELEAQV